MDQIDVNAILQLLTVGLIIVGGTRRLPSKADIDRLHDRFDKQDEKFDARFDKQDEKFDARFDKQDEKFDARFEKQDRKFDARFEKQDKKFDARFDKQDSKIDDLRRDTKSDLQRIEDRSGQANEYHARSVELLDAIRRELEERRQPL